MTSPVVLPLRQDLPGTLPACKEESIISLAQELLSGKRLLSEVLDCLAETLPKQAGDLGLSASQFSLIETAAAELGPEVALVGHKAPDFDCIASCAIAAFLLQKTGKQSRIFVDGGRVEQLSRRLDGFSHFFKVESLDSLPPDMPVVLLDCLDSGASHVNVPGGRVPVLVIDTHHGRSNGAHTCISENHAAATTMLLAELFQHFPPGHAIYREQDVRRMMTFAFLGIMTDTAELRRATPFEVEAARLVIPCLDEEILRRFQRSSFNRDVGSILDLVERLEKGAVLPNRQLMYRHEDEFLFCYLGALHERYHDVVAAAADEVTFRHQGTSPALVLFVYYDRSQRRLVGSARLDLFDEISASIDLSAVMQELFTDSGTRGRNVGGGKTAGVDSPKTAVAELGERYFAIAARLKEH